mmetsp:Transcript_49/g.70  ORF Transcript_49/g.70 Transcript_49/m.70 type:complete len:108 (-) Transcript_49:194-517(-)
MPRISLLRHPSQNGEWVLFELQGNLIVKKGHEFQGNDLGELTISDGKPHIKIGNYLLQGKVVKLPKPMVVLNRLNKAPNRNEIDIVATIREKYIFSKRPTFVLGGGT